MVYINSSASVSSDEEFCYICVSKKNDHAFIEILLIYFSWYKNVVNVINFLVVQKFFLIIDNICIWVMLQINILLQGFYVETRS